MKFNAQPAIAIAVLLSFLGAEGLRREHVAAATVLSMIGWVAFSVQVVLWLREGTAWRDALSAAIRLVLLALISIAVLALYRKHSGVQDAGVHVDAAYTFVGAGWFLQLRNPITFAGTTYSYPQFALMLLSHVPAQLIGFERLGPLAVDLGVMLTVALLLAVFTMKMVPKGVGMQIVTVALTSAVFSNRFLVLSHDWVGYTIPAVCLGLMFLVVVDEESFPRPDTMVGGLLALALLHHLPAFVIVLPVCFAWVLAARSPWRRLRGFLQVNPVLLTVIAMFLVTVSHPPQLFLQRVQDVTVGPSGPLAALWEKAHRDWMYVSTAFPGELYRGFLVESPKSWFFLDVPALGGLVLPIVAGTWVCSALAAPGGVVRYFVHLALLAAALVGLSALQHLLTDMLLYRDFTTIIALMLAGLLFVLRASRLSGARKGVAWSFAALAALCNYADVSTLRGGTYGTSDYAPRSQAVLERLTALSGTLGNSPFGAARVEVVLDAFSPLESLYLDVLARRGLRVDVIRSEFFCAQRQAAIDQAASRGCEAFLVIEHTGSCAKDSRGRVRTELYESVCGATAPEATRRVPREVSMEPP